MSELRDYSIRDVEAIDDERYEKEKAPGKWVTESRVYLKSEADKYIEGLEETHKKEVVELKDSIVKLLRCKTEQVIDEVTKKCLIYGAGFVPVEHAMRLVSELRHHKYKRCLAMAAFWETRSALLMVVRIGTNVEWYRFKYERRAEKWLELAEKFKEAK